MRNISNKDRSKKYFVIHNSIKTAYIFRQNYLKELANMGADVTVIAPNDSAYHMNLIEGLGVKVVTCKPSSGKIGLMILWARMNLSVLKGVFGNTVVICHFLVTYLLTYPALLLYGNRAVLSVEGLGSVFSDRKYLQFLLKVMLRLSRNRVCFCNIDEKNLLGDEAAPVLNGIGVDLNKFHPVYGNKDNKQLFNLLFVGRLIIDKGVLDAIDVLRLTLSSGVNAKLTLVGDIYEGNPSSLTKEDISDLKKEFGVYIDFVGFQSDVTPFYRESDVLLLPSKREGFPVCVMEASASGIPVIAYNVPGCRDAIKDGYNGYLVTAGSVQAMYNRVQSLASKENDYHIDKGIIRCYAEREFDSKDRTTKFLNFVFDR